MLIIDSAPLGPIWEAWAAQCPGRVQFRVHAKFPERVRTGSWEHRHLVPLTFRPEWGSVELVRAALALCDDIRTQWFALVSESCVPVWSCGDTLAHLVASGGLSWVRYHLPSSRFDARACAAVAPPFTARDLCKSDQWVLLSAADAAAIHAAWAASWTGLRTVPGADEWFWATVLGKLGAVDVGALHRAEHAHRVAQQRADLYGIRRDGQTPLVSEPAPAPASGAAAARVVNRRVTFCKWPSPSAPHPSVLDWSWKTVTDARMEGCLFARKVSATLTLEDWLALLTEVGKL
jgi:hypothetical protein